MTMQRTRARPFLGPAAIIIGSGMLAEILKEGRELPAGGAAVIDLTALLQEILDTEKAIRDLVEKLAPAGAPPGGISLTVATPWIGKEPVQIFQVPIRAAAVYRTDTMVDIRNAKRLTIRAESSLNQPVALQLVGNFTNDFGLTTNIGLPVACPANGQASIGLAWGDWQPYVGVIITLAVAATSGQLTLWSVIQE